MRYQRIGSRVIQIQHGVGVLAAAAVEHIGDVDMFLGHSGGEFTQGIGDIPVHDGNTTGLGADTHIAIGVIDGIDDVAVFQEVHHLTDRLLGAVILGFFRRSAQMRNGDDAFHTGGAGIGEVGDIAVDLAGLQCFFQGIVIHQLVSGKVQDQNTVDHLGECIGIEHFPGGIQQRGVQRNNVAIFVDLIQGLHMDHMAVQVPGSFYADIGVIAVDLHAQLSGGVGQRATHSAQANNTQPFVGDLMAGKLALALFHLFGNIGIILVLLNPVNACHHITAAQKHAAQRQLHNAQSIGAGGIEYRHTSLRAFLQGDVIDAGTGSGNGQKIVSKFHIVHGRTADQNGLGLIDIGVFRVIFRPKCLALGGNGVKIMQLIHNFHPFSFSKAAINSTRAFTPSIGMAL